MLTVFLGAVIICRGRQKSDLGVSREAGMGIRDAVLIVLWNVEALLQPPAAPTLQVEGG